MSALQVFTYQAEHEIRTVEIDGEVWFVAADVAGVLELTNASVAVARLDDDERSKFNLGRQGFANIVSEPGLYGLIMASRKPEAKAFKRWITHEVIPTIRRTGSYGQPAAMSFEEMTAHVIKGLSEKIAALEAPANAWNSLSKADGDYTVSDAAKILARDGISTGPQKLFGWLEANKWIFRRGGRWQAMQSAVNAGWIVERVTSGYYDERTGERKQGDPQVRVTPKGIEKLLELLQEQRKLALVQGGAS